VLLHRVLLNLLSNAVQHTQSGCVLLACRPCGVPDQWRIEVRDSGIGIALEHQQKVFEEFYQVENQERDRSKGLGLGLSIVERSCKLLQHHITLRSALGSGSTFSLQLPSGQEPLALHTSMLPEAVNLPDIAGLRVLLIEDDELGRAALQGLLSSWGCEVVPAVSAESALANWNATRPPDFILSDYRLMGTLNGVDAVRQLRERSGYSVPACIISGDVDAGVQHCIASAGLVRLQKPVKPAKLRSLLRHANSVVSAPSTQQQA
jgi:CheY-like chemotaxis protein